MPKDLHPAQLRAARALLDWTRADLASAASTTERTITRLETGRNTARAGTAAALRRALEAAGVEFIDANGGGPGVRLRHMP
ncbi:helix-turn-helix domain-containing protein [Belnapia sp. T6]|uniref:Helix-turn-helix domain-containing protein n=1 Tax=Belnapia mucosa TaxID=2804532 RepID=A0ABS1VAZ9_9PROT|nr:helix-turn-helix transcriptional regulator [Belnapia mucosa]MBL6458833.1 helix-turn-helix domain-containing protein [Belnapia mucosa]